MPIAQRVDLGRVEVLTMRELTLHTAHVIERIRKDGLPRAIVKHGRFQASLWPLEENFESRLLARAISDGNIIVDPSGRGRSVDELLLEEAATDSDVTSHTSERQERHQEYSTVSMTEFNQATSAVVERVHAGQRLFVTRHGRYLALLTPLPQNLESLLLANAPEFLRTVDTGSRDGVGHGLPAGIAEAMSDS
jgi:antitoxin (DNA-binding transcriptional repressor) of toxin-antitoxin stability system